MATFDEQRALEDVEKAREEVLQARAERKRAEAAFEAFTSGFRTRQLPGESAALSVPPPPPKAPAEIYSRNGAVRAVTELNAPGTVAGESHAIVVPKQVRRVNGVALVLVGVALAGAAIFAVRDGQPGPKVATPQETPATTSPQETAATTATTPPTPVDTPAPVAKPPASPRAETPGVNVELMTRRRVWMRVTLDGQRAFEREVPADQHIPLHADRSILIRAGDAGAVAVRQNGRDVGTLGRDGVIATREFTRGATSRQ